jgi:nitrogen fixation NifU-like protein
MDIYKQNIIDHYKNPRNKGKLDDADIIVYEVNTLCGDALKFYFKLNSKGQIQKLSFEGEGCALSQATASMLTEELVGMHVDQVKKLDYEFIKKLIGIEVNPTRLKCVMLSIECLRKIPGENAQHQ